MGQNRPAQTAQRRDSADQGLLTKSQFSGEPTCSEKLYSRKVFLIVFLIAVSITSANGVISTIGALEMHL